jgi:SAM-dependent methyltransferase
MTNWDARYAHRDTPWDKGMAHPAIVKYVASHPLEGRILVPGCGTGHDVRAIATPSNFPVGLDISERAIRTARSFAKVGNETFVCGDLFSMPAAQYG